MRSRGQVVVTSGVETDRFREALLKGSDEEPAQPDFPWPREYRGQYLDRRRECGFGLYASLGIAKSDREGTARQHKENFRLFGAPHVAIVTTDEALGAYGAIDCGAYVNTFMLAARASALPASRRPHWRRGRPDSRALRPAGGPTRRLRHLIRLCR